MSHLSRADIVDLVDCFKDKEKKLPGCVNPEEPSPGLRAVMRELKRTDKGPPPLRLREMGKILKHYNEAADEKPETALLHFNIAIMLYEKGHPIHVAIKKARVVHEQNVKMQSAKDQRVVHA